MGDRLLKYYDFVKGKNGATGAMRLAMLTQIPSTKAGGEPDSPENLRKFQDAVKQITGEQAGF